MSFKEHGNYEEIKTAFFIGEDFHWLSSGVGPLSNEKILGMKATEFFGAFDPPLK